MQSTNLRSKGLFCMVLTLACVTARGQNPPPGCCNPGIQPPELNTAACTTKCVSNPTLPTEMEPYLKIQVVKTISGIDDSRLINLYSSGLVAFETEFTCV